MKRIFVFVLLVLLDGVLGFALTDGTRGMSQLERDIRVAASLAAAVACMGCVGLLASKDFK